MSHHNRLLKIMIVGNSFVGKSCILLRYAENTFTNAFYSTIGVDFKMKNITLQGIKLRLQIWDTAGQQRYRTVTSSYYKNAHAIMFVYDVTDRSSFEELQYWVQEAQKYGSQNTIMIIVGNKIDKASQRQVSLQQGNQYAQNNGFEHFQVSALNDENIELVFQKTARRIIQKINSLQTQVLFQQLKLQMSNFLKNVHVHIYKKLINY